MTRYYNTSIEKAAQATSEQNRKAALEAAAHGQRVFPVIVTRHSNKPDKKKADFPTGSWKKKATTDTKRINSWWDKHPDAAPGIMTGDFLVVDLDDRDGKDGSAAYAALGLDTEDALFAVETPSGGQHLYFDNPAQLTNSQDGIAPGIDTRGVGGFVFAPGAHTIFGEYRLKRGDLSDLQFGCLKQLPKPVREALSKPKEPASQSVPDNYDLETIREALNYVSSNCGYDDWREILMAVHHATGGSKDGLALVIGWSAGHQQFTFKEVQTKWQSFGKKDGPQITADTLFARARENEWNKADPDDLLTDDCVSGALTLADIDRMLVGEAPKSHLTFLSPSECEDLPSRRYVIKGLLAEGDIGTIVGAPGAAKSVGSPYLGFRLAQGENAFGRRTKQGRVFYVAAEDGLGMTARVKALKAEYGDAEDFQLIPNVSDLLATGSRDLKALTEAVKDQSPVLIIIDTIAIAFPGLEENDAKSMGRVVKIVVAKLACVAP